MSSTITSQASPIGTVHVIDDESDVRLALEWLLSSRGLTVKLYDSAERFLANLLSERSNGGAQCILTDVRMVGMSGLELQQKLIDIGIKLPIVFLTGHADVPMAVQALRAGAAHFFEKPFSDNELADCLINCLKDAQGEVELRRDWEDFKVRLSTLTPRERQVMAAVAEGHANKVIAIDLGLSMRTVEVHRARVFEKLGVRGAVELTKALSAFDKS
jgi:two-component system, LuxR family, response regulator DctR